MRSIRKKLLAALIFVIVLCVGIAFAACSSGEVQKPDPVLKVQSVTLRFEGKDIEGTLNADLSLGTVQIEALVVKDEGADGTVSYKSSDSSVAEIDAGGLITLKSSGETAITAEAGGKNDNFVLIVTSSEPPAGEYTITVTGGTSNVTSADAGECVYLTPQIPADKQFSGWVWDENIEAKEGNTFVMPSANVTVSAQFVNKLAGIYIAKQPESKLVANGKTPEASDFPGLKVMAEATLGNELWDVTEEMTFALDGDNTVTATYTLGEVSKSVEISGVQAVEGYVVDLNSFKPADATYDTEFVIGQKTDEYPEGFLVDPENINDPAYDKYKQTGYLGGVPDGNTKVTTMNGNFVIVDLQPGSEFTYYFWSEVDGNAWLTLDIYNYNVSWGDVKDQIYIARKTLISDAFEIYLNGSDMPADIREEACALEQRSQFSGDWSFQSKHNQTVIIQDMQVSRGWNEVKFIKKAGTVIRPASLAVTFDPDKGPTRHIWVQNTDEDYLATAATCTARATYYYSCADCGIKDESRTFEYGELMPHSWGEWKITVPATCTAPGERQRECSVCHAVETEVIANGHIWGNGTPVENGTKYVCTKCHAEGMQYLYSVDPADFLIDGAGYLFPAEGNDPADITATEYDGYKQTGYFAVTGNASGQMRIGQEGIWCVTFIQESNKGDCLVYYFWSENAGTATLKMNAQSGNRIWNGGTLEGTNSVNIAGVLSLKVNGTAIAINDGAVIPAESIADEPNLSTKFYELLIAENVPVQAGWNRVAFTIEHSGANVSFISAQMNEIVETEKGSEPVEHSWTENPGDEYMAQPANCLHKATYYYSCSVCGAIDESRTFEYGELGDHSWGEWETVTEQHGCASPGERQRTCSVCGKVETEELATEHKWNDGVAAEGGVLFTCTVCGAEAMQYSYKTDIGTLFNDYSQGNWTYSFPVGGNVPEDINDPAYDKYKATGYLAVDGNGNGAIKLGRNTGKPSAEATEKVTVFAVGDSTDENKGDKIIYYFWSEGEGTAALSWFVQSCRFNWPYAEGLDGPNKSSAVKVNAAYKLTVNGVEIPIGDDVTVNGVDEDFAIRGIFFLTKIAENIPVQKGWNAVSFELIGGAALNMSYIQVDMNEKQIIKQGTAAESQSAVPEAEEVGLYAAGKREDIE